jgi:hypothetical protein
MQLVEKHIQIKNALMVTGGQTLFLLRRKRKQPWSMAVFGFDANPVKTLSKPLKRLA